MQQLVGGKNDGKLVVLIEFNDFLVSSIYLDVDDAIKLRDSLNAMSEGHVGDDDGEGWKKGRSSDE